MQALCTTHGEVEAKETYHGAALALHCACGLQCLPLEVPFEAPKADPLGLGLEPVDLEELLEVADQGGGWFDFDGVRRRGRAAALRYLMEGE